MIKKYMYIQILFLNTFITNSESNECLVSIHVGGFFLFTKILVCCYLIYLFHFVCYIFELDGSTCYLSSKFTQLKTIYIFAKECVWMSRFSKNRQ